MTVKLSRIVEAQPLPGTAGPEFHVVNDMDGWRMPLDARCAVCGQPFLHEGVTDVVVVEDDGRLWHITCDGETRAAFGVGG